MTTFKDFQNRIKFFDNQLNINEQNLFIEYIKTLEFDFLLKQDPIYFIDNLIINKTLIKTCKDFKKSKTPASAILCKHKDLFLIDATL